MVGDSVNRISINPIAMCFDMVTNHGMCTEFRDDQWETDHKVALDDKLEDARKIVTAVVHKGCDRFSSELSDGEKKSIVKFCKNSKVDIPQTLKMYT